MASFAEECRRALGNGVGSAEEMAEWHCYYAALDLQLITRCSVRSALDQVATDFMIGSMHKEPIDEHEPMPAEPSEHLICSYHDAVALLRTYMGTANSTNLRADRSELARDATAPETAMYSTSVVRSVLKLAILMETAAGLAFFGWVLNGG